MAEETQNAEVLGDMLIPVINKLQDIFSQVTLDFKLNLPQVAVVGSQSSGKSSVLEALVGRDFLPRGPEICTRRPLVLQLVKVGAAAGGRASEWGEFLHAPGKVFHDFDRIRQEIQAETERVSGLNKGVSEKPIRLKICSPHVLTMTLVDLPGITKVPVGDQPSNIEQKIREMVFEYIRHPSCIILAVSPANVDLVNSDALQMAQMVDAEGKRTIGVITKLDIMDRGTNAVSVLKNQVVPLQLGYVAIVNRSQADINTNKSMAEARKMEEAFFLQHPEYSEVSSHCSVGNLAKRLNTILVDHIRAMLPSLRHKIEEALEARVTELRSYGEAPPGQSGAARGALLLQLLSDYSERFSAMLDGKCEDMPTSELAGGARVRHVFQEVFVKSLREMNPGRELTDDDIRTAIRNSAGVSGALLIPQEPFEILVRRSITKLLPRCLQCKDIVYEELVRIAHQACPKELARFPHLERRLADAVHDFILAGALPAESMIRNLVECEHDYINTDNPEFIGGSRAVKRVMEEMQERKAQQQLSKIKEAQEGLKDPVLKPKGKDEPKLGGGMGPQANGSRSPHPATNANLALGLKGLPESDSSYQGDPSLSSRKLEDDSSSSSWFSWFHRPESRSTDLDANGGLGAGSTGSTNLLPRLQAGRPRNEQEEAEVEIIRLLVGDYFNIVRKNLQDLVPKTVMHFLVHHSQRGLQQYLIRTLYREELFDVMMSEREDIMLKREACITAISALRAALKALDELPAQLSSSLPLESAFTPAHYLPGLPTRPATFDRQPSMAVAARLAQQAIAVASGNGDSYDTLKTF